MRSYGSIHGGQKSLSGDQAQVALEQIVHLSAVFDEKAAAKSVVSHVVQDLAIVSVVKGHTTCEVVMERILLNDGLVAHKVAITVQNPNAGFIFGHFFCGF